jgi:hypothetical protein
MSTERILQAASGYYRENATGTYLKPEYEDRLGVNGRSPGITFYKQIKIAEF